jgi:ribose-phosphate pyrophosphokinase
MAHETTTLFALDHSLKQTQALAVTLGIRAGTHEERRFPDGEFKLRPTSDPLGTHAVLLASLNSVDGSLSPHDRICRLLFMSATLLDHGACRVSLAIPYLSYVRKDRRTQPLDPASFRYLAQWIEASGACALATLEPHNQVAFDCGLRMRALAIPSHALLLDTVLDVMQHQAGRGFSQNSGDDRGWTVVSPDLGGAKRAQAWCDAIEAHGVTGSLLAVFNKRRARGVLTTSRAVWGDVVKRHVLIVDDLIGSGRTLLSAAQAVKQAGARRVLACVAHGFFEGDALARLLDSPIECLIVSDSTGWTPPGPESAARIRIVNVHASLVRRLIAHP